MLYFTAELIKECTRNTNEYAKEQIKKKHHWGKDQFGKTG
jgi:hypothetical protein